MSKIIKEILKIHHPLDASVEFSILTGSQSIIFGGDEYDEPNDAGDVDNDDGDDDDDEPIEDVVNDNSVDHDDNGKL